MRVGQKMKSAQKLSHLEYRIHNFDAKKSILIIYAILSAYELVILAKFHNDWIKTVDFFINSIFMGQSHFFLSCPKYLESEILVDAR